MLPCTGAASSQLLIPAPSRAVCNAAVLCACASPCPTLSCQCSSTAAMLPLQHTRTQNARTCHTMTHVLGTFWRIVDTMTYGFTRNEHSTYISISLSPNSLKSKNQTSLYICKGLHRTHKTFCPNKEMRSAAVKHNNLFLISLLCQ